MNAGPAVRSKSFQPETIAAYQVQLSLMLRLAKTPVWVNGSPYCNV